LFLLEAVLKSELEELQASQTEDADAVYVEHPSLGEAFKFWLKLGFISFGGPAGPISIMLSLLSWSALL
jgi:hypothetical protein